MAREGAASSAIWAVALIIIVAMIIGVFYFGGQSLWGGGTKKVDVEIKAPGN